MNSIYTPRQVRFVHVFSHRVESLLKNFLNLNAKEGAGTSLDSAMDGASNGVNTLSAAVAIAGVAAAAPTLGTSIAGASACIVLLQTLNGGYQFVKRHIDNRDEPFSPDETKLDEIHLSLTVLLRQVAHLAAVRYRHFIDEILEESAINTFASFVADRAMKKLAIDLAEKVELTSTLDAGTFLDYFMASARLSITHKPVKVTTKEDYCGTSTCSSATIYAKLACSRPGLAVYDESSPGQFVLYVSPENNLFQINNTTLQKHYGFATVAQSELSSNTAAVNRRTLQQLSPESMQETLNKNKQHFSVYHQVSRKEVSDYLIEIREAIRTNQPLKTLNQYLSESLNTNLIAACDDDRLRGLDLSDGNFSEVWFVSANLTDCNLRNSVWTHAHLSGAHFENNELHAANFQNAHAEKTIWHNVNFSGDFSHANLSGAKITDCTISSEFSQYGCEWELVEMTNVKKQDAMQLINLRFDEQINQQRQDRIKLNEEISSLSQQYKTCIRQNAETNELTVRETLELASLKQRIQDLENLHAQHCSRQDVMLEDIETQFALLKSNQNNHVATQDEVNLSVAMRLDKLEHKPPRTKSRPIQRLSIFRFLGQKEESSSDSSVELNM